MCALTLARPGNLLPGSWWSEFSVVFWSGMSYWEKREGLIGSRKAEKVVWGFEIVGNVYL